MTNDKLNPDALRSDMEAGTPGPWRAARPSNANGWWVVFTDADDVGTVDESGDGGFEEATARRIARLPDLERGYLDALARAEAAEAEAKRLRQVLFTSAQRLNALGAAAAQEWPLPLEQIEKAAYHWASEAFHASETQPAPPHPLHDNVSRAALNGEGGE